MIILPKKVMFLERFNKYFSNSQLSKRTGVCTEKAQSQKSFRHSDTQNLGIPNFLLCRHAASYAQNDFIYISHNKSPSSNWKDYLYCQHNDLILWQTQL